MKENHYSAHHHPDCSDTHDHNSLYSELICHFPYAVFSVALGLVILSFLSVMPLSNQMRASSSDLMFHCFHFIHILFASTGTYVTFARFSSNKSRAFLVSILSPIFFCSLSDVIIPYIGGNMLGVTMSFHLCFLSEYMNIVPFLVAGILNGFALSKDHHSKQGLYSLFSHAAHIVVSSLASLFYLVSHGFYDWHESIGTVFIFLVIAVVIPCTLSDVVVPMLIARADKKR